MLQLWSNYPDLIPVKIHYYPKNSPYHSPQVYKAIPVYCYDMEMFI